MKINHNIQALNAYRNLYSNQAATSKNLEKLSSGMRINRAADDAAGLAISEKMRSQIRGLKQAERNSMDGISLMQTAEGAMTEVHSMLQRMRELAVQAANDTNTATDREAIQKEVDQLKLEIDSIAEKTEFNTRKLLDGSSAADTQFIAGEIDNTNIKGVPVVVDASMKTGQYAIGVLSAPEITYKLNQPGAGVGSSAVISMEKSKFLEGEAANTGFTRAPQLIDQTIVDGFYDLTTSITGTGASTTYNYTLNGETTSFPSPPAAGTKFDLGGFELEIPAGGFTEGTSRFEVDSKSSNLGLGEYTIVVSDYAVENGVKSANIEVFDPDGFSIGQLASEIGSAGGVRVIGENFSGKQVEIDSRLIEYAGTAKVQVESNIEISVGKVNDDPTNPITPITFSKEIATRNGVLQHGGLDLTFGANAIRGTSAFDLTNKALAFQIGANTNQNVMIDVPQLSTVKLGIDEINVLNNEAANDAIFKLENAITQISNVRSKLGATQNRLEHTINNLQVTNENLTAAESRIRDADMALEMTEFTKNNILNQSAQAMLAQANQLPQGVLQLLQR